MKRIGTPLAREIHWRNEKLVVTEHAEINWTHTIPGAELNIAEDLRGQAQFRLSTKALSSIEKRMVATQSKC